MKPIQSNLLMTKKELLYYLKDKDRSFYEIFGKEPEQVKDLTSNVFESDLIVNGSIHGRKDKNKDKIESIKTIQLYAIRLEGKMFTYCRPLVPIHVYLHNYISFNKKTGKNESSLSLCFHAATIDDASMFFRKHIETVEDYEMFLEKVKVWLNSFIDMPSQEDFEKFWIDHGVESYDFDYN